MIPTAGTWGFFDSNIILSIFFGTKYDANLEIIYCQVLFYQPLHTSRSEELLESTVQNTKFCALLAWTAAFEQSDSTEKCYSTAH